MTDKSSTHQRVTKNGEEGWIVKEMWDKMVSKGKTNGFMAVATTPPEVQILKQKQRPEEPVSVDLEKEEAPVVDPTLTGEEQKIKGKPGPKPKV